MLIRVRGGEAGIKDYLENGQKTGRDAGRERLDERVILAGDLALTDSVIQAMTNEGERYLHITLAFREDAIARETLQAISEAFRAFAFAAYAEDEYCYYAEAHLPRLKRYAHQRSGEPIERKPHIHVVIPEYNLLSGRRLNPFGRVEQQTKFLEAFQEACNARHGLASPKAHRRLELSGAAEMLSRYKGDVFQGAHKALKEQLLAAVLTREIRDYAALRALVAEFGEVRTRNAGKPNEYLNVKPAGAARGVNLKEAVFSRAWIALDAEAKRRALAGAEAAAYSEAGRPQPTPAAIEARLAEWRAVRARELKYLNSGNRKLYQAYRAASAAERRAVLAEREARFNAKYRHPEPESAEPPAEAALTEAAGSAERPPQAAERADGGARSPGGREQAQPSPPGERRAVNVPGQLAAELAERRLQAQSEPEMAAIKLNLDARRLLAAVSHSHGVAPEKYPISTGRDGGERIACGSRHLNVSDFLTRELHLPWREAQAILRTTYAAQRQAEPQPVRPRPGAALWAEYRGVWRAQRQAQRAADWARQRQAERERRAGIRQAFQERRRRLEGERGLSRAARRAGLALARMDKALAEQRLGEAIRQERAALAARYPSASDEQYRAFLAERAEQGNEAALLELRRQSARASRAEPGTARVQPGAAWQEQRAPLDTGLAYRVDARGDVHYF